MVKINWVGKTKELSYYGNGSVTNLKDMDSSYSLGFHMLMRNGTYSFRIPSYSFKVVIDINFLGCSQVQ